MAENSTRLAQNIRYLRRTSKMSQEDFANQLGIKRSNIAAYESKNVEPRLRVVLEIAKYFDVSVKSLINRDIENSSEVSTFNTIENTGKSSDMSLDINDNVDVTEFIQKSIRIKKVLEGFKSFYAFKKNALTDMSPDKEKLIFDIDNFMHLIEHLLSYNETIIQAISTKPSETVESSAN